MRLTFATELAKAATRNRAFLAIVDDLLYPYPVIYEACCNDGDEIQAADEYLFDDGDVVAQATLAAALLKDH